MKIFLIRHTAVEAPTGMCYGLTDPPPAASFQEEVAFLVGGLAGHPLTHVFTSPLNRCMCLASALWPRQAVQADDRLRELDFGQWEGRLWEELPKEELMPWMAHYVHAPVPGGESYRQLYTRAVNWWHELMALPEVCSVAVVTHKGVILALLAHVLGLPLANAFQLEVHFSSITVLEGTARDMRVAYMNYHPGLGPGGK